MKRVGFLVAGVCVLALVAVAAADTGRFGAELLAAVSEDGSRNALVSPVGIHTVLAMVSQGATAEVRRWTNEIAGQAIDPPSRQLDLVLAAAEADAAVELRVANGAFADRRLDLFPAFAGVLEDRFGARVERLDFASDGAVTKINDWVAKATREAIPGLLSRLDPDDALVLANAIHFRGEWAQRFDKERTVPAAFHPASGDSVEVATMQADGLPAGYREGADFQAVLLPYGSGAFGLAVVLPRPRPRSRRRPAPPGLGAVLAGRQWLSPGARVAGAAGADPGRGGFPAACPAHSWAASGAERPGGLRWHRGAAAAIEPGAPPHCIGC